MRLAIFSDIHGNWEALQAVLADMDRNRIDSRFCLGDCVGYGPEPERVVREIRNREIPLILGNHELGLVDPSYLEWFNPPTRTSLRITRKLLSADSLRYLETLGPVFIGHGCRFVHGFPPDSISTYLYEVSDAEILHVLTTLPERICFIGHTHDLHLISVKGIKSPTSLSSGAFPLLAPRSNTSSMWVAWANPGTGTIRPSTLSGMTGRYRPTAIHNLQYCQDR